MAISSVEDLTIHKAFEIGLRTSPHKAIQIFEDGTSQSFSELEERANRLANGLMDLGLAKSDHVGMLALNCPEYMEYYLAMSKAGFVCVPINSWLPTDRIAHIIDHAEIKALIFEDAYLEAVVSLRHTFKKLDHYILLGDQEASGVISYRKLLAQSSEVLPDVRITSSDPHMLMYTAGTTGMPKGVMKNMYGDMLHAINCTNYYHGVHHWSYEAGRDVVALCIPPQFHIGGESMTIGPMMMGGTMSTVLVRSFEPEKILGLIHKYKVTAAWLLPTMVFAFRMLPAEVLAKYDVGSMRYIICGSTTLSPQDREDLLGFFPNADLGSNYACTETGMCGFVHLNTLQRTRPENLGKPCAFCEMMIGDENGNELPLGETGAICIRSPGLPMKNEYYKDPEKTEAAFKKGWFMPGDLGWKDQDGYIYYMGRMDDIIMSGGEKVSPLAIEAALQDHPNVNACVVVGVPDEKWGEAVTAMVVPYDGAEFSEDELIEHCRRKKTLAKFEIPKHILFVDSLPTGTTGKVLRTAAKEMARGKIG